MARRIGILEFEEPKIDASRKILHVDMDAFFASVEQRDNPKLRGRPVVIARHPKETGGKGVVATASYEARKYGIHSAMSAQEALERCPQAVFVPPRHDYYEQVSSYITQIFSRYTDLIEPLSIDEAFLDVTHNTYDIPYGMSIAQDIQKTIRRELGLTCSIGVSYNKFLAKLGSDYHKPNGMTVITPKRAIPFLESLTIDKFPGIGEKTVAKLHEDGIFTGKDLKALSQEACLKYFGKNGLAIYERVRGVDDRPVTPERSRKSVSKEQTFYPFIYHEGEVERQLRHLSREVAATLKDKAVHGQLVRIKIRYGDFTTLTRQRALREPIDSEDDIYYQVQGLWRQEGDPSRGVRLLGVGVSDLTDVEFEPVTLPLDDFDRPRRTHRPAGPQEEEEAQ